MSFPRYPKYKASGVEWLGEVPAHWAVAALAYRYRVELGKMLDAKQISGEHLLPYVRNADVQWGKINVEDLNCMDFAPDERERFRLRPGDLLVCEGGEVGRCAVWDSPIAECYYQKAIHRLRAFDPATDDATFLRRVLEAAVRRGCFASSESKATIAHLPAETFRRHRFAFPPLPEQRAIAAFLDRETAKIDGLVAEQRRLIELLKEKRQAVISHAVTKGLDPKAPMKPSGVEWLGDVPAHWAVRPLRSIGSAYGGLTGKTAEAFTAEGPNTSYYIPFTNILNNTVVQATRLDPVQVAPGDAQNEVHGGDLLFLMSSEDYEFLGFSAVVRDVPPRTFLNSFCKGFRPHASDGCPEYLNYFCRSRVGRALISQMGFGFTRINLRTGALLSIPVLYPPLPEQRAIAAFLDRETAKIDGLVAEAESAITLLQERRSALISAAVTGQIDVRNAVATEVA